MKSFIRYALFVSAMTLGLCHEACAQWIVFDPTNFGQNIITAAKAVKGEIYQDTNIVYQYQMMANQLLQSTSLNAGAMKDAYNEITGDISQISQYKDTLTQLYGSLQDGAQWIGHVQNLISTSGKSPTQWYTDMRTLYDQGNAVATNIFQMGNNIMTHTQELAQRRAQLQSQLSLSPTQQATAQLTTHYLDIVSSQNADMLQLMAAKAQQDAQKASQDATQSSDAASVMQSFTAQQSAERAKYDALPSQSQ
jgi:conjugal transfer/entry exclusion protein